MPLYHVDIASVAASVDKKWIDNLLSHHTVPGVEHARQGIPRRLTIAALMHIVLIRRLTRDVGVPVRIAVSLASKALANQAGSVRLAPGLHLAVDHSQLAAEVESLVAEAVESVVRARRGRPLGGARN